MNKAKFKDILIRCLKTFIQGFLATLVVNFQSGNAEITKSLVVGALAGGISALMNLIIKLLTNENDKYLENAVEFNELSEQNNDSGGNK